MIKRLLVANRGEIAVRVIRACREAGIETVAVYSTADRDCLHARLADRALCIGPAPAKDSYLRAENLITAALHSGCAAVHPGVGFLSENAAFARAVEDAGLVFVGPSSDVIELLGDKVAARKAAAEHGLPVTPGTEEAVIDASMAEKEAARIGFPVIIKAAAGGGGKGMRIVREASEVAANFALAQAEAEAAFADKRVFIERFIEKPRHVELQILASDVADGEDDSDADGIVILGERDCTVQKNHQKLIEESPSPAVTAAMRERMYAGSRALFRALKYRGAGTIEFLVTGDEFFFMEVNARVQVEHPVSEMVSGVDIIREMLAVAGGGSLSVAQKDINLAGHALECRINALSPGRVARLEVGGGPGVRFDSFLYNGYTVLPYYDAMLAKLITHDHDRPSAIRRMKRALAELVIEGEGGLRTNLDEQRAIIDNDVFKSGTYDTRFYEMFVSHAPAP